MKSAPNFLAADVAVFWETLIKSAKQTGASGEVEEIPLETAAGADLRRVLRYAQMG